MSLEIPDSLIGKLDHKIPEIRIRTLENIEQKLKRTLEQNEELQVNGILLIKGLFKWLHESNGKESSSPLISPSQSTAAVVGDQQSKLLDILYDLFKTKNSLEIIQVLGTKWLCKELSKIVLTQDDHQFDNKMKLEKIRRLIIMRHNPNNSEQKIHENLLIKTPDEFIDLTGITSSSSSLSSTSLSTASSRSLVEITDADDADNRMNQNDYIEPWDIPLASDMKSLKHFKDSLQQPSAVNDNGNLLHAMNFLHTAIKDFPPEYFLQPPYVIRNLQQLLKENNKFTLKALEIFVQFTKSLERRLRIRQSTKTYIRISTSQSPASQFPSSQSPSASALRFKECDIRKLLTTTGNKIQISIGKYFSEQFLLTLNCIKDNCADDGIRNYDIINRCYELLINLCELLKWEDSKLTEYHIEEIQNDIGYLTKYFRQSWENQQPMINSINRNQYIYLIFILCKIQQMKYLKINQNQRGNSNNSNNNNNQQWKTELELALFDYPLRELYPNVYETLMDVIQNNMNSSQLNDDDGHGQQQQQQQQILLNCSEQFQLIVDVLKNQTELPGHELILKGSQIIHYLTFDNSLDLVMKLFHAIANSIALFDGNQKLKETAENLLLQLLAYNNFAIKRLIYNLCAEKMKYFFSRLMNGEAFLGKVANGKNLTTKCYHSFGIPLTIDILIEIICFGLSSTDENITENSETILLLILRSKNLFGERHWQDIKEILIPVLPLLQCYTSKVTKLGIAILELLNPDNDAIPLECILQGNLRLLFCGNASDGYAIRNEAISRILYILSIERDSNEYSPNVNYITDVIPNNLCINENVIDPLKNFPINCYEKSSIYPLIKLLECSDVEPSVRKTTLIQLNIMANDPQLNEIIHNENGILLILTAISNSLKTIHTIDYPDSCIPSIGILSKFCLKIKLFRRELSKEHTIYYLLIRALLLYHQNAVFKSDCTMALFLLLFNDWIIGGGRDDDFHSEINHKISIPFILYKKLCVPFRCDTHWKQQSPYRIDCKFNEILMDTIEITGGDDNQANTNNNSTKITNNNKNKWQYLRLTFANIWFNGLENIEIKSNLNQLYNNIQFDNRLKLNVADLALIQSTKISNSIGASIRTIENATNHTAVLNALTSLENSISLRTFTLDNRTHKIIPIRQSIRRQSQIIINVLKRFCISTPNTTDDNILFIKTLEFIGKSIEMSWLDVDRKFFKWIIKEFLKNSSIHLNMLAVPQPQQQQQQQKQEQQHSMVKDICDHPVVYDKNCKFIGIVLKRILRECENIIEKSKHIEIFNRIFTIIIGGRLLDDKFEKRELNNLRSLLYLLQLCTKCKRISIIGENGKNTTMAIIINSTINKLFYFIVSMKSLAQSGSHFNKLCLKTIRNLMNVIQQTNAHDDGDHGDEWNNKIESKYIKFLSGLCGHNDYEIRTFAWSILLKLSMTLNGAEKLILELAYLPGGFHACCLSTFLDTYECSIVRETAGYLFSNLINHSIKPNNNLRPILNEKVKPICSEWSAVTRENDDQPAAIQLIMEILKKQQFFEHFLNSIKSFYIKKYCTNELLKEYFSTSEDDDCNNNNNKDDVHEDDQQQTIEITSCDCIRAYCNILLNLLQYRDEDDHINNNNNNNSNDQLNIINKIYENYIILDVIRLIPFVQFELHSSSVLMLIDVCQLATICCLQNERLLNDLVLQEHAVINSLINLLDIQLYADDDTILESHKIEAFIKIIRFLKILLTSPSSSSNGIQTICQIFANHKLQSFIKLIIYGLEYEFGCELSIECLEFLMLLINTSTKLISDNCRNKNDCQSDDNDDDDDDDCDNDNKTNTDSNSIDNEIDFVQLLDTTEIFYANDNSTETTGAAAASAVPTATPTATADDSINYCCASEMLFYYLIDCFDRCKNEGSVRFRKTVYRTISILLYHSKLTRSMAIGKQFLFKIIQNLKSIFSTMEMSCAEFIRRFGNDKKEPIIDELQINYEIVLNWYARSCLQDETETLELCKITIKLWSWLNTNAKLQKTFLKTLAVLSEDSLIVCRSLSTTHKGYSHSILMLLSNYAINETSKVKHNGAAIGTAVGGVSQQSGNTSQLEICLYVISNCCASIDGRLQIGKLNLFDNLNRLHPQITKQQRQQWIPITINWLKLYEIYTRYPEGNSPRFITLLYLLYLKSTSSIIRQYSIMIFRNMSFGTTNKIALLSSEEYLNLINIVLENGTIDEQFSIMISIWKLIANNYKGKYTIKNSSIPGKLRNLQYAQNTIADNNNHTNSEFLNVLELLNHLLR